MAECPNLLHAVLDNPGDDAVRLIFADWLEQQPDAALNTRGEFLRLQVELDSYLSDPSRRGPLEDRQRQLLAAHEAEWLGPLAADCTDVVWTRGLAHITMKARTFATKRFGQQAV